MNHKIFQEFQREIWATPGDAWGSGRGEQLKLPQAEPGAFSGLIAESNMSPCQGGTSLPLSPSLSSGYRSPFQGKPTDDVSNFWLVDKRTTFGIKYLDSTPNCATDSVTLAKWIHLSELQFLHLSPKDTHIYSLTFFLRTEWNNVIKP